MSKGRQVDLGCMPERDDLGKAAAAYVDARDAVRNAKDRLEHAAGIFSDMAVAAGRDQVRVDNRLVCVRVRAERHLVSVKNITGK